MKEKIILLADDDFDDTEMFCEALANIDESITCHCVANGNELLKQLHELNEKPHLIFLDLNMPIMNGWQCLTLLKENEHYRHIPVIMISTSSHKKEIDMAMNLGALCYFVKPSNFNELTHVLQIVANHIESTDSLKEAIHQLQTDGSKHLFSCH